MLLKAKQPGPYQHGFLRTNLPTCSHQLASFVPVSYLWFTSIHHLQLSISIAYKIMPHGLRETLKSNSNRCTVENYSECWFANQCGKSHMVPNTQEYPLTSFASLAAPPVCKIFRTALPGYLADVMRACYTSPRKYNRFL